MCALNFKASKHQFYESKDSCFVWDPGALLVEETQ